MRKTTMSNTWYRRCATTGLVARLVNAETEGGVPMIMQRVILAGLLSSSPAWADVTAQAENCAACHGKDGASSESGIPIIGGYSAAYLTESLTNYKNKARP